jgi:hypothetical protein
MLSGAATLDEIQEALRTEARNPQLRMSVIETACTTVGLGVDGRPGFAARMDPEFRRELDRTRRAS